MTSFMSRIPKPKALAPTDDAYYYPGGSFYGGNIPSSAGIAISSDYAMRQMTVNNCVRVLFNCVSQMPCQLMQEVNDIKSKAKDHHVYRLISKRPNSWMTAPQFWGMAIVHISLRGNFYAYKSRVGTKVKELLPIAPDRVVSVKQNSDWSLTYKISTATQGIKDYTQDDIFHIRGLSLDGIVGLNPIEYARECIGLGLASELFLARYFGKGLHPGAIIEYPQSLDPVTHKNLWEAYRAKYGGLSSSQDLMLLDNGMKIQFPTIKLVDAQFLEQMRFTESQICGMYGVPLILVQAGDSPATYASSTEFKRNFVDMTLAPIAVNFETTIDRDCLTDIEQDRYYSKFNLNSLLRGNIKERFGAYVAGINAEFLSPNEARDLEDLNPYPGGDEYRTRTSTTKSTDNEDDKDDKSKSKKSNSSNDDDMED